jgi:hypothetical protein
MFHVSFAFISVSAGWSHGHQIGAAHVTAPIFLWGALHLTEHLFVFLRKLLAPIVAYCQSISSLAFESGTHLTGIGRGSFLCWDLLLFEIRVDSQESYE